MTKVVLIVDVASLCTYKDSLVVSDYQLGINAIKYTCLKFLTYFGTTRTRWGYKFYSSNGLARQRMEKRPFCQFNLDSFQDFEDELVRRFERYKQACDAIDRNPPGLLPTEKDPPCSILRAAVTQVVSEYQWDAPNIASPVKVKSGKRRSEPAPQLSANEMGNYVFNISLCPRSESDLAKFLGTPCTNMDIAHDLMPTTLRRLFLKSICAKLVWVDTGSLSRQTDDVFGYTKICAAVESLAGVVIPVDVIVKAGYSSAVAAEETGTIPCCTPFSCLAASYLGGAASQSVASAASTVVICGGDQIGTALFYADSTYKNHTVIPRQIRVLTRMRQGTRLCAFHSVQVLHFYCVSDDGSDCVAQLELILMDLIRLGEALFVELDTESALKQHGFLFPLSSCAFSLHTLTELSGFPVNWTDVDNICCPLWPTSDNLGGGGYSALESSAEHTERVYRTPFRSATLEKWYVPQPSSCSPHNVLEPLEVPSDLLKKLQREYRLGYPNNVSKEKKELRPRSEQPSKAVSTPRVRKCLSASLNACRRSAGILANTQFGPFRPTGDYKDPVGIQPVVSDDSDYSGNNELVAHLQHLYDTALDSDLPTSLLTCAQNIVSIAKRSAESHPYYNASELLKKHLVKGCFQIAEKYAGLKDEINLKRRLHEYQLQALLALEEHISFEPQDDCVDRVTSLLRTLSFIYSPSVANEFLKGIVRDTYLTTLKDILVQVGEQLNVSLLESTVLSSEGEFRQPGSVVSLASQQSQDSYLSSIPSSFSSQRMTDASEGRPLVRADLSQTSTLEKRQIVVQRSKHKRPDQKTVRASSRKPKQATPTKVKRASTTPQESTPKRRRILKTKYVPETPSCKQGRRVVLRRQEVLRRRSGVAAEAQIVEETPEKLESTRCSSRYPPSPQVVGTFEDAANETLLSVCEQLSLTPKRPLRQERSSPHTEETPPHWRGSEELFSSPQGNLSNGAYERTPKKCVMFADSFVPKMYQQGVTTPRRKVSKKLLSSPSSHSAFREHLSENSPSSSKMLWKSPNIEASQKSAASSRKTETPRRLFNAKASTATLPDKGIVEGSTCKLQNGSSENITLRQPVARKRSPLMMTCTSRFTRSKSRETGLTPQELFLLSQASPVKDRVHDVVESNECENKEPDSASSRGMAATPRRRATQKISYTPPSALSLLHLTSSPMLLHK